MPAPLHAPSIARRPAPAVARSARLAALLVLTALGLLLTGVPAMPAAAAITTPVPETPQFRRLGIEQGLPSSRINGLAQDRAGYLWIATDDGVARFDGIGMRVWRHNPGIVGGMPSNLVNTLHVDPRDQVWLAFSSGGVGHIGAQRQAVQVLDAAEGALAAAQVWAMAHTDDGAMWFGAFGGGLFRRDATGAIRHFAEVPVGGGGASEDVIALATAPNGMLWIGTARGLARVIDGRPEPVAVPGLDGEVVMQLGTEPDGTLWISTRSALWRRSPDGEFALSPWAVELAGVRVHGVRPDGRGGRWIHTRRGLYFADADGLRRFDHPAAIEGDYQQALVDRQGGLWFGDAEFGLVWLAGHWRSFATFSRGAEGAAVSMRQAVAFAQDAEGRVLLGGEDGHLDRLDPVSGRIEAGIEPAARFDGARLYALAFHPDGALWVGAAGRLLRRDTDGRWASWTASGDDALPPGAIDGIVPMPDGDVWIAAYGGGLQRRDARGRVELAVTPDSGHGLTAPAVDAITRGPDDALWVGNRQGLLRWNGEGFDTVIAADGGAVQAFAFAGPNELWVYRPGILQAWHRDDGRWRLVDQADSGNDGLPSAEAAGLVHDAAGRLWIFTVRGLVRFDPATRSLRRFGPGDGLPAAEFGLRPPAVLAGGTVIAGSVGGAVMFDPMAIDPDPQVAPMVIESVSVRRAEDLVTFDPVAPIVLRPDDRDLRVAVRLMAFADPAAHRYRFRLEGYDPDWVEVGAAGERLLPRQPPGMHRLDVIAAGADGRWSAPQRIEFRVLPPWWMTWWAWTAYAIAAAIAVAVVVLTLRRRLRARVEAQRVAEARRAAQQASDAKTAFLADLGHELRTPLTGVLGMTELLLKEPLTAGQRQRAETVLRAGQHLLRLVNDTLDLARIESGRLLLHDEGFDLSDAVADAVQMLRPTAEAKGVEFRVTLAPGLPPRVRGDQARLKQILLNLGGNAVKFTDRGHVELGVAPLPEGGLRIDVEDTGIGLDAEQQQRLFRRFAQADGADTQLRYGGTGLGLAISRELARAMGGDLELESRRGAGSRFTVRLPLRPETGDGLQAAGDEGRKATSAGADDRAPPTGQGNTRRRPLNVLLVEDDPIVAEVVIGLLEALGHRVHHANQALIALTLLKTERIDVGLLDLDLPAVDGFELATMIRQQGRVLPLLAITARADAVSERRARAAGMDGYLRKPVSGAMLAETLAALAASSSDTPAM